MAYVIGVDTGETFTDTVTVDDGGFTCNRESRDDA